MKAIILLIFIFASVSAYSQNSQKFYFETDISSKISVGEITRKTFFYTPGLSINVPVSSRFYNPVYGLGLSLNYNLSSRFSLGIGSGINITKFDKHPVISDEYYDRVTFPLLASLSYTKDLHRNWFLLSRLKSGYQFADFRFVNTEEGFTFQETGGLISSFDVGLGRQFGQYTPHFTLGYEFNQFSHEDSLGWISDPDITYDDKVFYKTHYHLLKIAMNIKM